MIRLIFTLPLLLLGMLANFNAPKTSTHAEMTLCVSNSTDETYRNINEALTEEANPFQNDSTKAYTMPLLSQTPKGDLMLSWTEKDAQGITSLCIAFSSDKGKTFSAKKTVYSGAGVSNSRMMRAKVLAKKDGSFVAVFANRPDAVPNQGGRSRTGDIAFCVSKDGGNTWTSPKSVDADPTQCMRGFFDAVLMANDEVAVAYLKDVANSTKHEERNLRLVTTKNGVFESERIIDPVVCDCCPISLLLDANGGLNVYYRDNNDNIRDMAKMTSTDNGATFSTPKILHDDQWKINGCPHSGAISSTYGKSALIAWFSGAEKESGLRLATQDGQKLFVISNPSAKNAYLVETPKTSVMLWEQNKDEENVSQIAFRKINNNKVSETNWLNGSSNATNVSGLTIDNQILVAYEVKQANKRNSIKISTLGL
jgi:BNR repeat-like domain